MYETKFHTQANTNYHHSSGMMKAWQSMQLITDWIIAMLKSMRTASDYKKQGVASKLLAHLIKEAQKIDYKRLSLETDTMDYFKPARSLYEKHGFSYCPPFADYAEDPNSVFMSLPLG